jgi:acyl CoA:acetate/3-ketoacid CoA transferase
MFASLQTPESGKIVRAEEAVRLIRDGDTVATGGFVGIGFAEEIAVALEALYLSTEEQHIQVLSGDRSDAQVGRQFGKTWSASTAGKP